MESLKILALIGLIFLICVALKWLPKPFTKLMEILGQMPRIIFMLVSGWVMIRLKLIFTESYDSIDSIWNWNFLATGVVVTGVVLAIVLDGLATRKSREKPQ